MKLKKLSMILAVVYGTMAGIQAAQAAAFDPEARSYQDIFDAKNEKALIEASNYVRANPSDPFTPQDGSLNLNLHGGQPLSYEEALQKVKLVRYPWFDSVYNEVMNKAPQPDSAADKLDQEVSRQLTRLKGPRKTLAVQNINLLPPYMDALFARSALGAADKQFRLADAQGYKNIKNLWAKSTSVASIVPVLNTVGIDQEEVNILKARFNRPRPNRQNNFSFPSGHTYQGYKYASSIALIFPERTRELMSNALQYGESRVIVKAHWPTDTIASRTANYFNLAHLLADDEIRPAVLDQARAVRADFAAACGDTARRCLAEQPSPIADGYAAQHNEIGYYGARLPASEAVQRTVSAQDLPAVSANLLRLRFPYLSDSARLQILADTAYPADTLAGWMIEKGNPNSYWGVIDLPRATLGPVKIEQELTVDQKSGLPDDIADFGKDDTWSSDISGSAQLIKRGDGSLTLSGNNRFGGFQLQGGELSLSGRNDFSKLSTVANSRFVLKNGVLNGSLQAGQGAVISGEGTLGSLTLNQGSVLRPQHGQEGTQRFAADGTQPAKLRISKDIVFNPGSDYRVELTKDGRSTHLDIGGTATLNGGSVSAGMIGSKALLSDADTSSVVGNRYHILHAQQGVQGQFDSVKTQPLTLMTASLSYTPNDVSLNFRRNDAPMGDFGQNGNQASIGSLLDNIAAWKVTDEKPLAGVISDALGSQQPQAADTPAISMFAAPDAGITEAAPNAAGSEADVATADLPAKPDAGLGSGTADLQGKAGSSNQSLLAGQLDQDAGVSAPAGRHAAGYGLPVNPVYENIVRSASSPQQVSDALRQLSASQVYADQAVAQLASSRYVRDAMRDRLSRALIPSDAQKIESGNGSLWLKPIFSWAHVSGSDDAAAFDQDTQGFLLGVEGGNELSGKAGLLAGYTHSKLDSTLDSRIKSDNIHLGLYAGRTFSSGLHLSGGLAHTWHRNDASRRTSFGRINEANDASFNARSMQAYAELAWKPSFELPFYAEPFANVAYVRYKNRGFTEDGVAGYHVEAKSYDATLSTLGLRGAWQAELGLDQKIEVSAEAGWQHRYGKRDDEAEMAFKNTSRPLALRTVPLSRDSAVLSAGVAFQIKNTDVSVKYSGVLGGKYKDNTVSANLQWRF